jgi:hypothetical protein
MRQAVAVCAVGLSCALAVGGAAPLFSSDGSAVGSGAIHFGKKGEGVGYFDFAFQAGPKPTGTFVFAGEDHHRYPHVIIRLDAIETLDISGRTVTLKAKANIHDEPVILHVSATDADGSKADTFGLRALESGKVVFEAEGELFIGDIQVGADE